MADDVAEFIQAMGLEKPLICGYSDGGQIALELGMNYPGIAQAYVAGGVYGRLSESQKQAFAHFGMERPGVVNVEHIRSHMPDFAGFLKMAHAQESDPERWQTLLKQVSELWWMPLDYEKSDYERIQEPMLIVLGDRDEFIPTTDAALMYGQIPNAELAILPNADHMSAIGASSMFMNVALDFLERRSNSP